MKLSIEAIGVAGVIGQFDTTYRTLVRGAGHAVEQTCRQITDGAQSLVPVRTGTLRSCIGYRMAGPTLGVVGVARPGSEYWFFVEFGTLRAAAHPYMRPAGEAGQLRFFVAMNAVVTTALP